MSGEPEEIPVEKTPVLPLRVDVVPATEAEAEAAGARRASPHAPFEAGSTRIDFGGRLNVELRIVGMLGLLWWATTLHAVVWGFVILSDAQVAGLPWGRLALPHAVGMVALMVTVVAQLPRVRWPRMGSLSHHPSPLPLALAGVPLAPLLPYFIARDRKARDERPDGDDVEVAFRQLLGTPRVLGAALLAWLGVALLVDALLLAEHLEWEARTSVAVVALLASLVTPMVAIGVSRIRAMLRPELISAPRPRPSSLGAKRDLRSSLAIPSFLTLFGVTVGPLLGVWLWQAGTDSERALKEAEVEAASLVRLAQHDPASMGERLAAASGAGVSVDNRWYGRAYSTLAVANGPLDLDDDGHPELIRRNQGSVFAVVPVREAIKLPPLLIVIGAAFGLLAGCGTLVLVAADVGRDIERATAQVRAVADGEPRPNVSEGAYFAMELRQLVQSVERLVNRITETNIAKYVAIEKAKEADRLKSQFLANMSHDLRSPLNSILGFSELLLTGIEGELGDEQTRMVTTMYDSGRELLQQIDDILDTAKIDAGRMEVHPEPTPPANLISRATQNARKRMPKAVLIDTETAAGLPPAFVDPYRTVQALENVLVFAAERLEEGRIETDVETREMPGGRMVVISVRTPTRPATGEELTAVLRGFYRIPGHRGLGLGLPIAGSILELQGGTMDIIDDGKGATFEMHLPAPAARRPIRYRETRR